MGQVEAFNRTFLRGLETTRDEGGAPDFSGFRRWANTRVGKDTAERRPGSAVVGTIAETGTSFSFRAAAADQFLCAMNEEVWALDRSRWCLDFLAKPVADDVTGYLIEAGSIKIAQVDAAWEFDIGTVNLTTPLVQDTVQHLAICRNLDTYELWSNGVLVDSDDYVAPGAVLSDLVLGRDAQLDVDFLRLRTKWPASWAARELRLLNPRAQGVLACYRNAGDANGILWDYSTYEMHGRATTPVSSARLGPVPHAPVQGITTYVDESDRRHLLVVAAGQEWDGIY